MGDTLFDVRNALTVGNYHQAIAEGNAVKTSLRKASELAAFNNEKDALLARAQIGLGQYDAVISQLNSATEPLLVAVRLFAQLRKELKTTSAGVREPSATAVSLIEQLKTAAEEVRPDTTFACFYAVAALIETHDFAGALLLAKKWLGELPAAADSASIRQRVELHGLVVEALLRINRSDLAQQELQMMERLDDESLMTLLYSGIVNLHIAAAECSADRYNLALTAFREVNLRSGSSVLGLNLISLAQVGLGEYEAAERSLLDALAIRSGDPDTEANLAMISPHVGKTPEAAMRYVRQACGAGGAWARAYAASNQNLNSAVDNFLRAQ